MRTALTAIMFLFAGQLFAQEQEVKQRFIEVVGNSQIEVSPDIAYFSIIISDNPKENISISKQQQDLVKILARYNVPSDNLTVDKISGLRQKVNFWGTKEVLSNKSYTLKLTDLSSSDKILDEISALKISSIALQKVESSTIESQKLSACEEASANALAKAKAFAKGMGTTLLSPLTINEQYLSVSGDDEDYRPRYMMAKAANSESNDTLSDAAQQGFKNITIKCSVRVKVEIK